MKIFQAIHRYILYIPYFEKKYDVESMSFEEHRKTLIEDRFYALHILQPCLDVKDQAFFTMWDYEALQHKWAKEKGWQETDLKKILFAQIEEFGPDVFYTSSSDDFPSEDLDANLKKSIIRVCWSAAPGRKAEAFKNYKTRLTNFPEDVLPKEKTGFRTDLFQPAYDKQMAEYVKKNDRPIDLFFYGQYVDTGFDRRNQQLERLLEFKVENPKLNVEIRLQYREKEEILVNIPYIRRFLRKVNFPPPIVRKYSKPPTYGLDLYEALGRSKIVFNAGVDFSGKYKVNMRNFEVLGCGAHLISDEGVYPTGFEAGKHFSTYENMEDCITKIKQLLADDSLRLSIAEEGNKMVKTHYSKEKQWEAFQEIVASL
jgi:hypothetical protein